MDRPTQVLLQDVLQTSTLPFFWYKRTFALCADGSFRRYDGEQLRHSAAISGSTSVQKVGSADFKVTFLHPSLQPELRYHIRAESSAQRDKWVLAITDAIARQSRPSAAAASAAAAAAPVNNYATDWACERGLMWPKAVDYTLHCPKRHVLSPVVRQPQPLCHVCGGVGCSGGGMTCAQGCTYSVCSACLAQLQRPPAPAAASAGGGGFPSLGVSAGFLRAFQSKWRHVIGGWTTEQVCQQLVKPLTSRSGRSVCQDLIAAGSGDVGEAKLVLSHSWSNNFLSTVDAVLAAAAEAEAAAGRVVYIWFDVFSTSQHCPPDMPSSNWMRVFRTAPFHVAMYQI